MSQRFNLTQSGQKLITNRGDFFINIGTDLLQIGLLQVCYYTGQVRIGAIITYWCVATRQKYINRGCCHERYKNKYQCHLSHSSKLTCLYYRK